MLDNLLRPVEPLLTLACASFYAGGQWGSFKLAESLAYLLFHLSLLGLDRGLVWWFGQSESSRYRHDLFASLRLVLLASLVGILIMLGTSALGSGDVRGLEMSWQNLLAISASIPLLALSEVLYQANLNQRDMIARILGKNIVLPLTTFGGALLSHWISGPGLPFWFLLGALGNFLVALGMFVKLHGFSRADVHTDLPSRPLLGFSLPLVGADLLSGLMGRVDLMLLGGLSGIRAVEIYNVVMMIGRSLQTIRQSFEGILLSAFSRDGAVGMTDILRARLNHAVWAIGNLLGLALLAVVFWGETLLSFMNSEYRDGYMALVAVTSMTYLNVFGDLSGLMLQGLGRSRSWTIAQLTGFAVNVGANLLLIPRLGALGGVLSYGGALLVQGAICQYLLWRASQRNLWLWEYLRSLLLFAAVLIVASLASLWVEMFWLRILLFTIAASGWIWAYRKRAKHMQRQLEPA